MPKLRFKVKKVFLRLKKIKPYWENIFLVLGLIFILSIPVIKLAQQRNSVVTPMESSSLEPIRPSEKLFTQKTKDELIPQRIIISSVGIDLTVKPAKIIKGKWEVFDDVASFGLGSAPPGTDGNTVIFAHARRGLFLALRDIKTKDRIYVLTKDRWFSYEVSEIKEVLPNQIEVISPTSDERLTLYTCSGFADSKRLIVVAKRTHL